MSVRVREIDWFGLGFQKVLGCCKQANKIWKFIKLRKKTV
jgi:hypothetical protein